MRNLLRTALALLLASMAVTAQQYTISTIAGRGQPLYYPSALDAAIQPMGVAVDSAGAVYFSSANAVYRLDSNGGLRRIAGGYVSGCAGDGGLAISAQLNQPFGIAVDATGAVYIADWANNRIRIVSPDGVITSLIGSNNPDCGPSPVPPAYAPLDHPGGVAVDGAGVVYITDTFDGVVRKVSNGVVTTLINTVNANWGGVAVDTTGNVYIIGRDITKITPGGMFSTLVPNVQPLSGAVDADGNVYFSVPQGIERVTPQGSVSTFASGFFSLNSPLGMAIDAAGNLYVACLRDFHIRMLSASGVLSTIAGNGTPKFSGDGGPATDALFFVGAPNIGGIALDAAGSVYVADTGNDRVRKITPDGTITTIAGGGTSTYSGYTGNGGQATDAVIEPWDLAIDPLGNLYIAEGFDIRKVGPDGVISTFQTIPAYSLALGPDGSLYAADTIVNQILPTGAVVPVAGNGFIPCPPGPVPGPLLLVCSHSPAPPLGDGGPATQATIFPAGIAVDSASNLYIADGGQSRIREVLNSTGVITTIVGTEIVGGSSTGYSGDGGPATNALLNSPRSVAFDDAGNLYIADQGNYRIRKVSTDGIITTIAGNGVQGHSGDGGPALDAEFLEPTSLAIDPSGNIYVSDQDSIRLLKPCPPAGSASTSRR